MKEERVSPLLPVSGRPHPRNSRPCRDTKWRLSFVINCLNITTLTWRLAGTLLVLTAFAGRARLWTLRPKLQESKLRCNIF